MIIVVPITSNIREHVTSVELRLYFFLKPFVSQNCETIISVRDGRKFETKGTGQICSHKRQEDAEEKRSYSSTHAVCQKRYTGHDHGSRLGHYHDDQTSSRKDITDDLFRPQHVGLCSITLRGMSRSFNNHQTVAVYQT
jgi:hypothetical protein